MKIGYLQIGFGIEIENKISLNIYISGCKDNKQCNMRNCHNQQLRDFNYGRNYADVLMDIDKIINTKTSLVDCIVLLGGEPLDANISDLICLIQYLKKYNLPIYIYTGYTYEQIKNMLNILFQFGVSGICYGAYNNSSEKKWIYNNEIY